MAGTASFQNPFCATYFTPPCREATDYAPNSSTVTKYVRVVLHFFQNTTSNNVQYPPGNFTNSPEHMAVIRSWFDHPTLGINSRLANVCDPLPKVPGFESPHIPDAKFQFIFNGIENEDVFFYQDAARWAQGRSTLPSCPVGFSNFDVLVNNNQNIQNNPDLRGAVHVFFPAAGASFDANGNINCIQYGEGGYTNDFGFPGTSFTDVTGITLYGTYYRYIYDSTGDDLVGYNANGYFSNPNNIPYGGNGILAEWFHIMGVDHLTSTGSHLQAFCQDGMNDRCDDTPTTGNQNIYMSAPPTALPGTYCGLTECQLGRAHYFAEINRAPFIRFASNNFAYPAPWADCQTFMPEILISSNQTVTWDYERRLYSNVIVKSGSKLIIDCDVFMSKGAKIIVEPNAHLIVNSRITSGCETWSGIEVWGSSGSQYPVGGMWAKGRLNINNGATIENAEVAVKLYGPSTNEAGGIFSASGATFSNNQVGIEYAPYQNYWPYPGSSQGQPRSYNSTLQNCKFITNSAINFSEGFEAFVKMTDVNGVKFYGCEFLNTNTSGSSIQDFGWGIKASESGFVVDAACSSSTFPCSSFNRGSFNGLGYAVQVTNSNRIRPYTITQTDFSDNYFSIYNSGVSNATILHNAFNLGYLARPSAASGQQVGVYLEMGLAGFTMQENTFTGTTGNVTTSIGSVCRDLGEFNNEIRRNTYQQLEVGNLALGLNATGTVSQQSERGLVYLCNDNLSTDFDFYVASTVLTGTSVIRKSQGQIMSTGSSTVVKASGNKFAHFLTDFNNQGNPVDYFYYPNNSRENPINTSGSFNSVVAQKNDCEVSYCKPPCMSETEIAAEKEMYYADLIERDQAKAEYEVAENGSDEVLMEAKAKEIAYYQEKMDKEAYKVVLHLVHDTTNFQPDSLSLWINNLEVFDITLLSALQQQSDGKVAGALATISAAEKRIANLSKSQEKDLYNMSVLLAALSSKNATEVSPQYFRQLEQMASDANSYTGNLAKNILRNHGYYYEPIVPLLTFQISDYTTPDPISQSLNEPSLQLYPNPNQGTLNLHWSPAEDNVVSGTLFIFDATGRKMHQQIVAANRKETIDLTSLEKGIYFYQVAVDGLPSKVGKLLIK